MGIGWTPIPITDSYYRTYKKLLMEEAKMDGFRFHDLRHTFASYLINAGRSIYEVQRILGHTQIKTTQRYSHLSQDTLLAAANTAVEALGQSFIPAPRLSAPVPVAVLPVR